VIVGMSRYVIACVRVFWYGVCLNVLACVGICWYVLECVGIAHTNTYQQIQHIKSKTIRYQKIPTQIYTYQHVPTHTTP